MPRGIVVEFCGATSALPLQKIERTALYGVRRRIAVDAQDRPCTRAALTDDGAVLLRTGMTAQGWFTADGQQVESSEIGAVDQEGRALPLVPSTLDVRQPLVEVAAHEVLDLSPTAVYALDAGGMDAALGAALSSGKVYRFPFNYRPDHRSETGYLVKNDAGVFAIVGVPAAAAWSERGAAPPATSEDDDDGLDFEMF